MGSGLTALWGMSNLHKAKRADSAKHDLIAHTLKFHVLPAFGAEAEVAFHEFPNEELFALEHARFAGELFTDERRGATVTYDGCDRAVHVLREMSNPSGVHRRISLINAAEAVTENQDFGLAEIVFERGNSSVIKHDITFTKYGLSCKARIVLFASALCGFDTS